MPARHPTGSSPTPASLRRYRISAWASRRSVMRATRGSSTGVREPRVGVEPLVAEPAPREVEPAHARVLADVARDVRQLHRDAEVAGSRDRPGVARTHDERHHRADAAGDAGGVVVELRERLVLAPRRVPGEPLEQRLGHASRQAVVGDDLGEGTVLERLAGGARVDPVEPGGQLGDRRAGAALVGGPRDGLAHRGAGGARGRGGRVGGPVDHVVGDAAERVQRGGGQRDRARQQQG